MTFIVHESTRGCITFILHECTRGCITFILHEFTRGCITFILHECTRGCITFILHECTRGCMTFILHEFTRGCITFILHECTRGSHWRFSMIVIRNWNLSIPVPWWRPLGCIHTAVAAKQHQHNTSYVNNEHTSRMCYDRIYLVTFASRTQKNYYFLHLRASS